MASRMRLAAIVALALLLRCANMTTVPVWDWDEGGNINYASNLMGGRLQYFAYRYHFIPHPPLYLMMLAVPFGAAGPGIFAVRAFSVACSVAGLLIAYLAAREALGEGAGLLAALYFAVCPELVFWGRMGFANNLLGVLALSSMHLLYLFLKRGRRLHLIAGAAAAGLCPVTEYPGMAFAAAYALLAWRYAPKSAAPVLAVASAPFLIFSGLMLAYDGEGFVKDAGNYLGLYPWLPWALVFTAAGAIAFSGHLFRLIDRLYLPAGNRTPAELSVLLLLALYSAVPLDAGFIYSGRPVSGCLLLAFVGVLFIGDGPFRRILITYMSLYGAVILGLNRWDHMTIPLLYVASAAPAFFLGLVLAYRPPKAEALPVLGVAAFIAVALCVDAAAFLSPGMCAMPADGVADLARFLNGRTTGESLVIAPAYLAPGLSARTAGWEHALPYGGERFAYWRRDYGPEEFYYNLSAEEIDYAVLPAGGVGQFEGLGYGKFAAALGGWEDVYELRSSAARRPGAWSGIWELLGAPKACETEYVVLENPARRGAGHGP
jgi:hypothetical protein